MRISEIHGLYAFILRAFNWHWFSRHKYNSILCFNIYGKLEFVDFIEFWTFIINYTLLCSFSLFNLCK